MIREGETWQLHKHDDPRSECDGRLIADGPVSNGRRLVVCDRCGFVCAIPSGSKANEFDQERIEV